jgi:hypothetical protein
MKASISQYDGCVTGRVEEKVNSKVNEMFYRHEELQIGYRGMYVVFCPFCPPKVS